MIDARPSRRHILQGLAAARLGFALTPGANAAPPVGLIPRSGPPARKLVAFRIGDLTTESSAMQLTLTCLQGLVNRERPVLYLAQDRYDEFWLDWMRKRGDVDEIQWLEVGEVFERFLPAARCMFITDPAIPASVNVATMLAAVHNGLVATPETAKQYPLSSGAYPDSSKLGLDLRTHNWKKDVEAYSWAFSELNTELSNQAVAILDPGSHPLRDYLVEFKIPILWISSPADAAKNPQASPEEEKTFARDVLMKLPPNIPALGWPGNSPGREEGIGEWPGVRLLSECAKFEVCSGFDGYSPAASNMSVHSGTHASFRQRSVPPPKLDPTKVYCTFVRSDGDGLNFLRHYYRKFYDDPAHGSVPVAWEVGPTASEFIPDILDYFYSHSTPADCFVNALTGVGYIHEDNYADNFPDDKKKDIWQQYLRLSEEYLQKIDASSLATFAEMSPEKLELFARLESVKGIFANYGRTHETTAANLLTYVAGKPVFRALNVPPPSEMTFTPSARQDAEYFVAGEVKRWCPKERPAFLYVFLANWLTSLEMASQIAELLGPEFVFVRPDQLISLAVQVNHS